jgi:competence protein ComEC
MIEWVWVLFLPFLVLLILPRKKWISFVLVSLIFFSGYTFGNLSYKKSIENNKYFQKEILSGKESSKIYVEGVVKNLAYTSELSETYIVNFDNFDNSLSLSGWENYHSFLLLVEVPKNMKLSEWQEVSFTGKVESINLNLTNGFSRYTFGEWIVGKVFVPNLERRGNIWWIYNIRESIRKNILRGFPEKEAGIILWMTMGDKSLLVKEIRENFMNTGTTHILVVSGANIALILIMMSSVLRYFPFARWPKIILVVLSLIFYSILVGFDTPILRALCMGIVSYLAIMGGKNLSNIPLLGLVAFIFSIFEPLALVYNPSFWLSFWATLWIVLFWKDITKWLSLRNIPEWIAGSIAVTFWATIGSLPAIIYHFWNIPVSWIIVNILIWSIVWIIMLGGMFYILLSTVWTLFLYSVGLLVYLPTKIIIWITDIFSDWYILSIPEVYKSTIMIFIIWLIFSIILQKELGKIEEIY